MCSSTGFPWTPTFARWPRRDDRLADVEGGRQADRLDGDIDAKVRGQLHHALHGLPVRAVDHGRRAELLSDLQTIVVQVDDDNRSGRVELRGHQRGEPDRPGPDDGDRVAGFDGAVQHATLECGRQDVAQHHERFVLGVGRNR
jgi:hypothetical protein